MCFEDFDNSKRQITIDAFMFAKDLNTNKFLQQDKSNVLIDTTNILRQDLNLQRVIVVILCESIYNAI